MERMSLEELWKRGMAAEMPISRAAEELIYGASRIQRMRRLIRIDAGLIATGDGKKMIGVGHARQAISEMRTKIVSGSVTRADVGLPEEWKGGAQ